MQSKARMTLAGAVALAALSAGVPAALHAQRALAPIRVTGERLAEADRLDSLAEALHSTPRQWREAARLHERAAGLRSAADPRGVAGFRMAAHLYRAAGDLGRARSAMERAGELAASRGDVVTAANTYVDAGLLALENRRYDQVDAMARKAEAMAYSPLLSELQRATIMNRVGYSQLLAALDRNAPAQ